MKQSIKKYIGIIFSFYIMFLVTGCDDETKVPTEARLRDQVQMDEYLLSEGDYSLFYSALMQANLLEIISGDSEYTVFAPNNEAFSDFLVTNGYESIADIPAEELTEILKYHILEGSNLESALAARELSNDGRELNIFSVDNITYINGATSIGDGDLNFENGVIHGINVVLMPPSGDIMEVLAEQNDEAGDEFTLFELALQRTGLDVTLGGNEFFTVFAPTDAAFEDAGMDEAAINAAPVSDLLEILNFHIVEGFMFSQEFTDGRIYTLLGVEGEAQGLDMTSDGTIDGSDISTPDLLATNGVIHVIDEVLFPDATLLTALSLAINISGNDNAAGFTAFYNALISIGYEENLASLEDDFTIITACCGYFNAGAYTDAELLDYIESKIFEGIVNFSTLPSGSRMTSIGDDDYIITRNSDGTYINGTALNAFGGSTSFRVYNGLLMSIFPDVAPLPELTIVEQLLANEDYDLIGAALRRVDIMEEDVDYTLLAVSEADFLEEFPGLTVATIDDLDDEADAEVLEDMVSFLSDHLIEGVYFDVDLIMDLPDTESLSEKAISFVEADGGLAIVDDPKFPTDYVAVTGDVLLANNGVIHELSRPLVLE